MFKRILTAGVLFAIAGVAAPAYGQSCALRDTLVTRLQDQFGEGLAAGGLRSDVQVLEIWAAPDTGTWTVLMTRADGIACILASGTNWHQQDPDLVLMGVPG